MAVDPRFRELLYATMVLNVTLPIRGDLRSTPQPDRVQIGQQLTSHVRFRNIPILKRRTSHTTKPARMIQGSLAESGHLMKARAVGLEAPL